MLNGFGYAIFGVPTRDLESTWRDPEDLESKTDTNGNGDTLITVNISSVRNYYIFYLTLSSLEYTLASSTALFFVEPVHRSIAFW